MQKIDFGDVNKFLVSIGLFLISLSIAFPYFYLKEDFGLSIESITFEKYTPEIQNFIKTKQNYAISIQKIIPWLSFAFFSIGIISSIVGLYRWFKRQSQIDKKYDLDIVKLELEIQSLTPEEKINKAKQEINEIELESAIESKNDTIGRDIMIRETEGNKPILDYLKIENDVVKVFRTYQSPNFEIFDSQRLGRRYEIDVLLKAKSKKYSDRIVDIKYFRKQISSSIVIKSIEHLNKSVEYYKSNVNNSVVPVLILVYSKDAFSESRIELVKSRINKEIELNKSLSRLKYEFVEDTKILEFDVKNILKK